MNIDIGYRYRCIDIDIDIDIDGNALRHPRTRNGADI